jgi:nucleoside-diphosphate-sugar epimerase
MSQSTQPTALVIGATGGIGGELARTLLAGGWRIRALNRNPEAAAKGAPGLAGAEWVRGDAMDPASVIAAARGAQLIVHGANPPGYRNWGGLAIPMLESTIAAAKASGARILFPGTVYNFGPDAGAVLDERSPQRPLTRKGAIRVEMEQRLEAAAREGVAVIIVRAGDFFGPRSTGNSWFANAFALPGRPVRFMLRPGPADVGHAWAYLPDLAEAMVRLVGQAERFGAFEVFHFAGHFMSPNEVARAVRAAAGRNAPLLPFPWPLVNLLSPFVETFRELLEMRYLWKRTLRLNNAKLVSALGAEPHTPLDEAVRRTLDGLGCLPSAASLGALRAA